MNDAVWQTSGPYLERLIQNADGTYRQATPCEWDGHNYTVMGQGVSGTARVLCTKCGRHILLPVEQEG
jgi:hypothetical protein